MHREYVYEVKPLLTAGENTLRLEFKSPRRYFAQQQHKHYLYMNDGDTLPGAAHLRVPPCRTWAFSGAWS